MRDIAARPTMDPEYTTSQVSNVRRAVQTLRAVVPRTAIAPRNIAAGERIHVELPEDDEDYPGGVIVEVKCPVSLLEHQLYTYYIIHPTTIIANLVEDVDTEGTSGWVSVLRQPTVKGAALIGTSTILGGTMFKTGVNIADGAKEFFVH